MNLTVSPGNPLRGEVSLPGDKSLSHRVALFAALAQGESRIDNFLVAGVTHAMLACLADLGVDWELDGQRLSVLGRGFPGLGPPEKALHAGHSGTTLRLLAGALAAAGIPAVLDGSPGLRRRPMARVVEPLRSMGVPIEASDGTHAPLTLGARPPEQPLRAVEYRLPVASAQVKTALLLAGLSADGITTLIEPGPSRDHTERLLGSMGVEIMSQPEITGGQATRITLQPPAKPLSPLNLTLPGDISSAAFLIVAALITPGSEIVIRGVGLNPTRTGLLEALSAMGANLQVQRQTSRHGEPVGDLMVRYSSLRGIDVDGALVVRMIDEFPAFAVAAALAQGSTSVRQAEELRHKESDRISALCRGFHDLGVEIHEVPDGFDLPGQSKPHGGSLSVPRDHRLAMSLAVAGLAARKPVTVRGAEIIAESFPQFVNTLRSLGADMHLEGTW